MFYRTLTLLLLLMLSACNAIPKQSAFEGLLPKGYALKDSASPMRNSDLKQKKIVVVASANLIDQTDKWVQYHEKGGSDTHKGIMTALAGAMMLVNPGAAIAGAAAHNGNIDAGIAATRKSSDPRNVTDATVNILLRYFKSVEQADDLASARDLKPDYIGVVDYHASFNGMGDKFLTTSAIHMLDPSIRRVFSIEKSVTVDRIDPPLLSSYQTMLEATAQTMTNGMQGSLRPMLSELESKLETRGE